MEQKFIIRIFKLFCFLYSVLLLSSCLSKHGNLGAFIDPKTHMVTYDNSEILIKKIEKYSTIEVPIILNHNSFVDRAEEVNYEISANLQDDHGHILMVGQDYIVQPLHITKNSIETGIVSISVLHFNDNMFSGHILLLVNGIAQQNAIPYSIYDYSRLFIIDKTRLEFNKVSSSNWFKIKLNHFFTKHDPNGTKYSIDLSYVPVNSNKSSSLTSQKIELIKGQKEEVNVTIVKNSNEEESGEIFLYLDLDNIYSKVKLAPSLFYCSECVIHATKIMENFKPRYMDIMLKGQNNQILSFVDKEIYVLDTGKATVPIHLNADNSEIIKDANGTPYVISAVALDLSANPMKQSSVFIEDTNNIILNKGYLEDTYIRLQTEKAPKNFIIRLFFKGVQQSKDLLVHTEDTTKIIDYDYLVLKPDSHVIARAEHAENAYNPLYNLDLDYSNLEFYNNSSGQIIANNVMFNSQADKTIALPVKCKYYDSCDKIFGEFNLMLKTAGYAYAQQTRKNFFSACEYASRTLEISEVNIRKGETKKAIVINCDRVLHDIYIKDLPSIFPVFPLNFQLDFEKFQVVKVYRQVTDDGFRTTWLPVIYDLSHEETSEIPLFITREN